MIEGIVSLAFVMQVMRIAVPDVLAALGGAITERSGLIDLALEGKLLFGAFTAAAVGHATGSAYAGLLGGIAAGVAVAAVQTACALVLGADQVIVGVALNIIALSGTRFLLQLIYGEGANSPPAPTFGDSVVGNPIVWIAVVAAIVVPRAVIRTRWGLRLRAAGDLPESLAAVGIRPGRARLAAALVGGALTGAGGAQLSLAVGGFSADMSSGRGYIAVAMVLLAGWRPGWAALACIGVAIVEAIGIQIQIAGPNGVLAGLVPLASLSPYVLTVVVLAIVGGKPPPRALGRVD